MKTLSHYFPSIFLWYIRFRIRFYILSDYSSLGFPELWGFEESDWIETFYIKMNIQSTPTRSRYVISGYGSLYLFPSAAGGSFSNHG